MSIEEIKQSLKTPEAKADLSEKPMTPEEIEAYSRELLGRIEDDFKTLESIIATLPPEEQDHILNTFLDAVDCFIHTALKEENIYLEDYFKGQIISTYLEGLSATPDVPLFTAESLDLESQFRQMLLMSNYGSKTSRALAWESLRHYKKLGGYHISSSSAESSSETRKFTDKIQEPQDIPALTTYDLEGGAVRPMRLTWGDLKKYSIPNRFLALIDQKKLAPTYFRRIPGMPDMVKEQFEDTWLLFPSQEAIGKVYRNLKKDPARKAAFLKDYEEYASALGQICRDLGINISFAPNVDLVKSLEDTNFIAKYDRAYSDDPQEIIDLATAYIRGFNSVPGVLVIPKHYLGTGFTTADLHYEVGKLEATPEDIIRMNFVMDNILSQTAGVMTSHIILPQDSDNPITTSKKVVNKIRKDGFDGVLFSDSLDMEAIKSRYTLDEYEIKYNGGSFKVSAGTMAIIETIASGHDIVFASDQLDDLDEIIEGLMNMVKYRVDLDKDGQPDITKATVSLSVDRILQLKARLGLLTKTTRNGRNYYLTRK